MDIVAVLRYVFDHNQQVIAGLVVFILITAIFLFLRAIGQESSGPVTAPAVASPLDLGAIETAFKKVMLAHASTAVTSSDRVSADDSPSNTVSAAALAERDAKVQTLAREIDRLTSELATKEFASFGNAQPEVDSGRLMELQEKLDELQGKLSEYEIIEDDIADLSRYKEENNELRNELERLKKETGARLDAAPSLAAAPAAASQVAASAPVFSSPASDVPSAFERVAPAVSSGTGEPGDLVMKEFASSIQIEISPILDDDLDTEKMLAEVASLTASGAGDDDALSETLDTDKLLSEVNSLSPAAATADAAAASPVAAASAPAGAAQFVSPGRAEAPVLEDDLLAEFKETNDGGQV